ncbi:hypothetical protein U1Q18_024484 [Sarracenia purpurea var. burkii]
MGKTIDQAKEWKLAAKGDSDYAVKDVEEVKELLKSAARDCVPRERNSFVDFQANNVGPIDLENKRDSVTMDNQTGDCVGKSCNAHQVFDKLSRTPKQVVPCVIKAGKPLLGGVMKSGMVLRMNLSLALKNESLSVIYMVLTFAG